MANTQNKQVNLHNIRYKNSMKPIDWAYYTKFYPEKTKAIQALRLDTGLGLKEAKEVVEEIFARLEKGEVEKRKVNAEYQAPKNQHAHYYNEYQGVDAATKEDLKKSRKSYRVLLVVDTLYFLWCDFQIGRNVFREETKLIFIY